MTKIDRLGDPHLGRSFIHGVPLHRRGEREKLVWKQFRASLLETTADLHVNMGDLFDKAIVSYDTIIEAAKAYNAAAARRPDTTFVIMKGNHDLLRDLERNSAFDLFCRLLFHPNIRTVVSPVVIENRLFVPYDPITPTAELIKPEHKGCIEAYGHWDTDGFGSTHNVIPTKQLAEIGITTAYTGHVHLPTRFKRDGVDVTVVGSMQPYAHGEEADNSLYITLSLDQLEAATDLKDKCVRVVLQPDEMLEDQIDCLQLTVKRLTSEEDEAPTVTLGDFNFEALFRQAFADEGVGTETTQKMIDIFNEKRLTNE